jgi:hypothetical protein
VERCVASKQMPQYQCHKKVWALKIKEVIKHALACRDATKEQDAAFEASDKFQGAAAWYRKHAPEPGGYYVVYPDGYKSYSPAKAFEEGYTLIK